MTKAPVATEASASPAATGGPSPADWALMLEPGEKMLWWGRPLPGSEGNATSNFLTVIGAFFALGGALFLAIGLLVKVDISFTLIFSALGAIFAIVGLGMIIVPRLQMQKETRLSQYALSDRRALVYDGRRLQSWRIHQGMRAEFLPGDPGSIIFDDEELALTVNNRPVYRDIGFLRIADAAEVMTRLRELQAQQPEGDTGAGATPRTDEGWTHYG